MEHVYSISVFLEIRHCITGLRIYVYRSWPPYQYAPYTYVCYYFQAQTLDCIREIVLLASIVKRRVLRINCIEIQNAFDTLFSRVEYLRRTAMRFGIFRFLILDIIYTVP